MATVKSADELRSVTVDREQHGSEEYVFIQITSSKLIPEFMVVTLPAEAWDELVAGAK